MPKISIILPVHNGARFLPRAAESVLRQTFEDWELFIIDDGSTDETAEVAKRFAESDRRIRCARNPKNIGIQKTLNRGLSLSRGEYIARIDDDDIWLEADKLKLQTKFLDERPDYVLLGTAVCILDESGAELFRYRLPESDAAIRARMLQRNCFTHSSVMFRREAAVRAGGYGESENVRHVEDYDLWLRIGRLGKLANLPAFATGFTLRPGNISSLNKLGQLMKDLRLTRAYRRDYPGYPFAIIYGYLRLFGYRLFRILPDFLKSKILRTYKTN